MPSDYAPTRQDAAQTDYAGVSDLWIAEECLRNYNADVVRRLSGAGSGPDVLEFGAGIGTLANLWHDLTSVKPECLEIDRRMRHVLEARGFICYEDLRAVEGQFDVIYSSNVLEHIDDDVDALKMLNSKLKPNGRIALYVPALMFLYSDSDAAVGHYRRYHRKELVSKLETANFKVEDCYFVDSIGVLAWIVARVRGYKANATNSHKVSLRVYDRYVYPLSRIADALGLKFLFGKNLLAIATKT